MCSSDLAIAGMDAYELSVEPIQQLNTSSFNDVSYDVVIEANETNGEVMVWETTADQNESSVTIETDPSYVEDRATVRIRHPDRESPHDLKYTVDIDLANETVTDVTDWDEIRQESTSVNATRELNTTVVASRP